MFLQDASTARNSCSQLEANLDVFGLAATSVAPQVNRWRSHKDLTGVFFKRSRFEQDNIKFGMCIC
jgi:hypothetical protein